MKTIVILISALFSLCHLEGVAGLKKPATPLDSVRQYVMISDGMNTQYLKFGLDPQGSDGIDSLLGEYEIPPLPPTGVFDARFIGTHINPPLSIGQGMLTDIRNGNGTYTGVKNHELSFQKAYNSQGYIMISWNLPQGITGSLKDIINGNILNDSMYNTGSIMITNAGIEKLFMKIYYNPTNGINSISMNTPEEFMLHNNYPNPFNSSTTFNIDINKSGLVSFNIYDIRGCEVVKVFNERLNSGSYNILVNFNHLPSGVYYAVLNKEDKTRIKKIVLIK